PGGLLAEDVDCVWDPKTNTLTCPQGTTTLSRSRVLVPRLGGREGSDPVRSRGGGGSRTWFSEVNTYASGVRDGVIAANTDDCHAVAMFSDAIADRYSDVDSYMAAWAAVVPQDLGVPGTARDDQAILGYGGGFRDNLKDFQNSGADQP